jgi:hypothetical protein
MVRAQVFVDDAVTARLIGTSPWRPFLVVGGGAAGAAAAIRAAVHHHVPTYLIERDSDAFNRQANCATRWIDPSQYDWPADHWPTAFCPCAPTPTPMPWPAALSHRLAALWKVQLRVARRSPWLRVHFDTVLNAGMLLPGGPGGTFLGWRMTFAPTRPSAPWALTGTRDVGAVLWAVGFGAERCDFDGCVGFPFWETDPFEHPDCGVPSGVAPDIVISGSGDGALQDYLRITTNLPSAARILPLCGLSAAQQAQVEREVYYAEDFAQRAFLWGPGLRNRVGVRNDHDVLHRVHNRHLLLTRAFLKPPGNAVLGALDGLIRKDLPSIRLIHSCDHFSNAYGLNRFLTLLIGEFVKTNRGQPGVFVSRRRLAAVTHPADNKCPNPPPPWRFGGPGSPQPWWSCHGRTHGLDLVEALDCRFDPQPPVPAEKLHANVLIIRHGINTAAIPSLPVIIVGGSPVPPLPDIALPRQMTAYRALT